MLSGSRLTIVPVPSDSVILRPPPPGNAIADVGAAVRDALRFPLVGEPLEALVRRGGRATIVIESPSLPIPSAQVDPRPVALAAVADELARGGIPLRNQTLLLAGGLARRPAERELEQRGIVAPEFARRFRGRVEVHDVEDPSLLEVGRIIHGTIELHKQRLDLVRVIRNWVEDHRRDFEQAVKNIAFFYVPFALLLKLLTTVQWSRRLAVQCFGLATVLALVFVGIGVVEYATRHLFWNRKVIASNEFQSYFRVNSLFFDPNIYGRFLAIVMVGLATALLWARRSRDILIALAALAVLWAGLILTFSETSFASLLIGLAMLAALRWNPRLFAYGLAACAVVVGIAVAAGHSSLHLSSKQSLNTSSSGRAKLVRGGLSMFVHRPVWGFGSGSFAKVFRERERVGSPEAATASHTTLITVAAEQGVIGLAAYAAVLLAAFRLLLARLGPLRGRDPPRPLVWRAFVVAAFAALIFHTLGYAAFLEDPIAWTLLAAGIVLGGEALPAPEQPPRHTREPEPAATGV